MASDNAGNTDVTCKVYFLKNGSVSHGWKSVDSSSFTSFKIYAKEDMI